MLSIINLVKFLDFKILNEKHYKYSVAQCASNNNRQIGLVLTHFSFFFFRQKLYQSGHFPFKDSNWQKFQYYLGTIAKSGTYISRQYDLYWENSFKKLFRYPNSWNRLHLIIYHIPIKKYRWIIHKIGKTLHVLEFRLYVYIFIK